MTPKNHPRQEDQTTPATAATPEILPEVANKVANKVADGVANEVANNAAVPDSAPDAADLQAQLTVLEQKLAESQDNFLRAKAETENVRRRAQEETAKAHKFGVEKFAAELLAVKDSLEAALASDQQTAEDLRSGVELTLKQLNSAFERSALKEINPVGEKFDPYLHQAIQMVPSELPANTVAQVLQKGYLIAERVLRPAMVMVSRGAD